MLFAFGPVLALSDALTPARNQMALSLGSHIILACFGMALPAMIFVAHWKGINGDVDALELAKRWSKVSGVLFAIGAVSGTILSFELGLLWPGLMEQYGEVIGLAFSLEGISFFLEAIFLGMYIYSWGKVPERAQLLMLVPVIASGVAGSFFVVSVNAWMNAPTGFTEVNGVVTDVDPFAAIFNSAVGWQFTHMFLAAYMVTGFTVASVYAVGAIRGRNDRLHYLGMIIPLVFVVVAAPIQPIVGHFAGQRIADDQPIKLAAIEGLASSETSIPITLGGIYRDGEIVGGIEIPIEGLGSFLAQNSFNAGVIGLDTVPESDQPPVNVVRTAFQIMVALGTLLATLATWVGWRWYKHRENFADSPWLLRALALSGIVAIVAMEAGWITTEVGRQPWIVHGLMRTEDAVTDADYIWITLTVLLIVYTLMGVAAATVLRSMSRRWRAGETHTGPNYEHPIATSPGRPNGRPT